MGKKAKSGKRSDVSGVLDFTDLPIQSQPEWSVIAVKAGFDATCTAVGSICKPKRIWDDPAIEPMGEEEISPISAVLEVRHSDWTTLVRSVCYLDMALIYSVPLEASALSVKLKSQAIAFFAEDTSSSIAYEIYDSGELVEMAEWDRGEFTQWGSKLRSKPKPKAFTVDFADEVFRERGIYVPGCYVSPGDRRPHLAATHRAAELISRVRLVDIPERRPPSFPKLLDLRAKKLAQFAGGK